MRNLEALAAIPSPSEATPDPIAARFAKALTEYGIHHSNCPYESWNKRLTRCKCGLFALIKEADRYLAALAAPAPEEGEGE